ncbi:MAG: hypothetical protein ACK4IK_00680 [Bacteroidia bacterium]
MKTKKPENISAHQILGIDLGNKKSGNTAMCYLFNNTLQFIQPKKGQDEVSEILKIIEQKHIQLIGIDAPLSLPGVYFNKVEFNDYQYRLCDKECKAMSPMFIGAFTARAIELKNLLESKGISVIEVYPKKLSEIMDIQKYYPLKKVSNVPDKLIEEIKDTIPFNIKNISNMHQFDALLCWLSTYRYIHQKHEVFGNKKEGLIIV